MSKHTPPPWKLVAEGWIEAEEVAIAQMTSEGPWEANASIIADAPDTLYQRNELLEALECIAGIREAEQSHWTCNDIAKAAIAKAKGETA